MAERSNEQWLRDLRQAGPQREDALADLRALLVRGLGYALASRSDVGEANLEDFAQDALLRILAGLDSFRGESRFITWAQKIAVNVAFTELRRRRWRDVSLEEVTSARGDEFLPRNWVDPSADTELQAIQREVLDAVWHVVDEELTDKQRQAFIAVRIHGMPMAEVARRMGTNRNALYKLLHDARKRIKKRMAARGLKSLTLG